MLKKATWADAEDVQRMALAFFHASPYKDFSVEESKVEELVTTFLDAPVTDKIVILWIVDEKPVGVLAGMAEQNIYNRRRFAGELIWWIDPPHRKYTAASEMLRAFEYWAKEVGCQSCSMVDLLGNLDRLYTRKGYEKRETAYLKVLT